MHLSFSKIAGAIATTGGVVGLPALVWQLTESVEYTAIVALATLLLLGLPAFSYLFRPDFLKRHGLIGSGKNFIVSKKFETVSIGPKYDTVVSTEKHFLFTNAPEKDDLVDIIEVLPTEKIDERIYKSSNSSIQEVVRAKDSTVSIFWTPNRPISLYVPHIHRSEYRLPEDSNYGPGYFWQGYHCDARTGICKWLFRCPEEVEEAVAYTMPLFQSGLGKRRLWKFFYDKPRRDCVQPTVSRDKLTVHWDIVNPKLSHTYVVIVLYKGGRDVFKNEALADQSKGQKIWARLISCL